jgi:hypothetical protein
MYPALLTLVTTALIVALYAELTGIFDAEPGSGQMRRLAAFRDRSRR